MKILQLIDTFNAELYGGAGKVFLETSSLLIKDGYEVSVICKSSDIRTGETFKGVKFYSYKDSQGNILTKFKYYKANLIQLFKLYLHDNKPDVIIIHSSTSVIGLNHYLRKSHIPIIYYFHSPWHMEYEVRHFEKCDMKHKIFQKIRKTYEAFYLKRASGIITLSQSMRDEMLKHHFYCENIPHRIIAGGASHRIFYPISNASEKQLLRKSLNLSDNAFFIITSRRLIPRTGVDILLRAFKLVIDKYERNQHSMILNLIITGKGESETYLKALVQELGLENFVIFTGYVSEMKLAEYYRISDLFVMPTRFLEGFGLSTVEAMASGIAVVGTNIGGTREIIKYISEKLLISEPSPALVAEKILFILNENIQHWSKKSLDIYKREFLWKKHTEKLLDFINEIIDNNR